MINLLPEENKKELAKVYRSEVAVVWCSLALCAMVSALVLLVPAYSYMWFQEKAMTNQIAVLDTQIASLEKDSEIQAVIDRVGRQISVMSKDFDSPKMYELLGAILGDKTSGAGVSSFALERKGTTTSIVIGGGAENRLSLLGFVGSLERDSRFIRVESPISNLVKDKEIQYSITLHAK